MDIDNLKSSHSRLLKEVMTARSTTEEEMRTVIIDAEKLIKDIEIFSLQVSDLDDYTWLSTAAIQWQTIFYSILGMPKEINISLPTKIIDRPEKIAALVSDSEVVRWIGDISYYYGTIRRAERLLTDVNDILQKTDQMTTGIEDMAYDWNKATVHFASEVVDGNVNLAHQLSADTYHRLESVWLKDVKELKAYFIWRHTKGAVRDNYFLACEQVRGRLLTCDKGSVDDFQVCRNYIEDRYLINGKINPAANLNVENMIKAKARRIWEMTGGMHSDQRNWECAEMYTKLFYEHIIPAVDIKNKDHALSVLKAFGVSRAPEKRYSIINCFEAVIAIYFIDADIIREILDEGLVTWNMIL